LLSDTARRASPAHALLLRGPAKGYALGAPRAREHDV